ncbi:hypothetical protein SLA2020_019400 [Shorea laevis]
MDDLPPYPPIDPTNFDLIVIGTGLPESVIAAAASSAGKSVLHLDPNPFYGSHFSSLCLTDLADLLQSHSSPSPSPSPAYNVHDDLLVLDLVSRPLYSSVEISNFSPEVLERHSRKFNVDVAGPRVFFCADKSIDLVLKSGASQYLEFKSIDASFVGDGKEAFLSVPDTRSAIFKDTSLGLTEKNRLMRFFKRVQGHLAGEEDARIPEEDLESPFVDFLEKMGLPPRIKSSILYAIAMVNYDQEGVCKDTLKTKDGIDRLALYNASVGRFQNALGAMIYPIYGQGELPQAFCRRAAVKGCLYVLRMPVAALLAEKDSGCYKGVRLASGQDITSNKLVMDPSFTVQSPPASSPLHSLQESLRLLTLGDDRGKVARGICITGSSLKPDISNLLLVYPPRSLFPEQVMAIRVLQIGSSLAVCPPGMFVLYISALCSDIDEGKKLLHLAMDALFRLPVSGNPENNATVENETTEGCSVAQSEKAEAVKPMLLWSAMYIQDLTTVQVGSINSAPMPDGNLNYSDTIEATVKLFHEIYPSEEFFPETSSAENSDDDNGLSLET